MHPCLLRAARQTKRTRVGKLGVQVVTNQASAGKKHLWRNPYLSLPLYAYLPVHSRHEIPHVIQGASRPLASLD